MEKRNETSTRIKCAVAPPIRSHVRALMLLFVSAAVGCHHFGIGGFGPPPPITVPYPTQLTLVPLIQPFFGSRWLMLWTIIFESLRNNQRDLKTIFGLRTATKYPEVSGTTFEPWRARYYARVRAITEHFFKRFVAPLRSVWFAKPPDIDRCECSEEQEDIDKPQFANAGISSQPSLGIDNNVDTRPESLNNPTPSTLGWYEIAATANLSNASWIVFSGG